jgi:DNA polymerase (family 10)/putative hydrolase
MKAWERYPELRLSGEWHAHTSFTDGTATVDQLCAAAVRRSVPLIAFTEHVRRSLDYDFGALLEHIDRAREAYDITILSGLEAKVLPDGSLDVDDGVLASVDHPIFAYHSFPADKQLFLSSLEQVISSNRAHAWAHPGTFTDRTGIGLDDDELAGVMDMMARHRVALEINTRYMTPNARWMRAAKLKGVAIIRGSDIHSLADLEARDERWSRMVLDP